MGPWTGGLEAFHTSRIWVFYQNVVLQFTQSSFQRVDIFDLTEHGSLEQLDI